MYIYVLLHITILMYMHILDILNLQYNSSNQSPDLLGSAMFAGAVLSAFLQGAPWNRRQLRIWRASSC